MSFSNRSLLSLARAALRLLTRSGTASPTQSRTQPKAQPKSAGRTSSPQKPQSRAASKSARRTTTPTAGRSQPAAKPGGTGAYPGDFRGEVTPVYAPSPDGSPDPGEVVWAWVPYEDDYSQGKDRPVLLIGHSGSRLLALMMTTKDRSNSRTSDPDYVDVGTGPWDAQGRPSEVKLDRVLQLDPAAVRRQGAVLSPAAFERVRKAFAARN
ncbi:type II toxin-antitoxin system PemK/MazF family toxin [Arthrobacter sp. zg-Y1219]|uniref:type II toxin-antitoxin system PemK/MazF family toxin n=1 Tax=Arthrobacter sp. zg-Y1219 TaxID=3049067 RepID=UPI0024C3F5D4|nr:type II toxin-antitoxin system PemK/MazF family toxin [Arthrobacter sp. zg-Y1219]MDK1359045.1 type II toxin-antitoxin system PemK/MazF family toxin [Arthrobacter sp. zg-Y1219]